ncbi:phosphodiester glycosidase family protein [Paenibacillus roseipurpureus]|uniref:Phosphodiester glycosidase family protein n=1 Tax=Paenibacillus roseopurpureus TaxID=2918901 RepID=A0AA96LLM0_9BACL|nr:phosphodiester glycosidase family protein [Paenibacillus sp. MBLB1832]WNR43244.1 phosphodiester glycosidase family protein [Paenibacillus sp. MBLB1832]
MAVQQTVSRQEANLTRKLRKRSVGLRFTLYAILSFTILSLAALGWLFLSASGTDLRYMMADTLITTQHRDWAKYVIGSSELQKRVNAYSKKFDEMGVEKDLGLVHIEPQPSVAPTVVKKDLVTIEPISGTNFKGHLVTISDPTKLRIAVPEKAGKGEKVSSMVKRTGAVLGVNGGGFVDPNWEGNGFQPEGVVISGGKIFYNDKGMNGTVSIVGIDKMGRMIAGKYKVSELLEMGVQEAVSFSPRFIVNGVGQVKSQADGWGIAPRTCMAQTKDGSILFAIIDGRQTHSIGATLYDIQEIFLAHGAITAANLDGGASTVLVHNNAIINKPSSEYGERYLPTAWLVFEHPETAVIKNVWEGLDISKIDPSKW